MCPSNPGLYRPVQGTIYLYRPANAQLDREYPIELDENGHQNLAVTDIEFGLWRAMIYWQMEGDEYYTELALTVGS
jgi:hypothetical protein